MADFDMDQLISSEMIFYVLLLNIDSCVEFPNFSIFVEFFVKKHAHSNSSFVLNLGFTMFVDQYLPFGFVPIIVYFDLVVLLLLSSSNSTA